MSTRGPFAALASLCAIAAIAFTASLRLARFGLKRQGKPDLRRTDASLISHASSLGIHAEEAAYNRSLVGCIPLGPNGKPKANLLQTALREQHALAPLPISSHGVRSSLASAGPPWQAISPAPIDSGSSADSGRVLSTAYDSALNGGTLFIGTAGGGVWSSRSPFTSWTTHTDGLPILAIDSVAVDPSDGTGKTIYAGSGEQSEAYDALYGQGVYKSTDGGATWAPVTGAPTGGWKRATISTIVVSTTGVVYVGVGSGKAGSGGVYISSDGGATWNSAAGVVGTNSVSDLVIDASNNVYAGVGTAFATQTATGVYECTHPCTSSSSWTLLGGGSGGTNSFPSSSTVASIKLTAIPTTAGGGGTAVYAIASNASNYSEILGVYRLLPGSATWTQIATSSTPANYENQAWYDMYIYGDPADASGNTVYFGLSDIYKSANATAVTPTWTNLTNVYGGGGTGVHPDQHRAVAAGGTVFFGNDGGMWDSTNGRTSFTDLNGNLATLQFYSGDLGTSAAEGCTSNCDPTAVIGGMQDNGTAQTSGGATAWTASNGFGDGGYALIDPTNNSYRYGENADGDVANSTDGGVNFNDAGIGGTCGPSNFFAPMALDPGTPTTLLAGMGDLCETTNANANPPTWTDISSGVTTAAIGAVAVSDAGGTKIYISDDNGHTYFTTNNGATWTSMDTGAPGGPASGHRLGDGWRSNAELGFRAANQRAGRRSDQFRCGLRDP